MKMSRTRNFDVIFESLLLYKAFLTFILSFFLSCILFAVYSAEQRAPVTSAVDGGTLDFSAAAANSGTTSG